MRHTRVFGTLGELEGDGDSRITQRNFVTGEETVRAVVKYVVLLYEGGQRFWVCRLLRVITSTNLGGCGRGRCTGAEARLRTQRWVGTTARTSS